MVQFRLDCDDGKGNAAACHSVGEYLSVVKRDDAAAAKIYSENCKSRNHAGSCFNFGRQLLTGRGEYILFPEERASTSYIPISHYFSLFALHIQVFSKMINLHFKLLKKGVMASTPMLVTIWA
jgi:hypothetical protein